MGENIKPKTRGDNIVIQKVEDEMLIYDLTTNEAFCLNETSALVYELCDGDRLVDEIAFEMSRQIETPIDADFVWFAVVQLAERGLLKRGEIENVSGMSRRKLIRKIGLTSLAVLPMIGLVVAPSATNAQSCLANGAMLPITFANPSTQPDATACSQNCFQPPFVANPEIACCSGIARSGASSYAGGALMRCNCFSYQCSAT